LDRVDEAVALADTVTDTVGQEAYRDYLGDRLRALGRKAEALAQYRAAVELAPDNSAYRRSLVLTLFHLGRVDEGVRDALRGVDMRTNPADKAGDRDDLGDLLREFGRKEEALAQYEAAVKLAPDNSTYLRDLANALLDLE